VWVRSELPVGVPGPVHSGTLLPIFEVVHGFARFEPGGCSGRPPWRERVAAGWVRPGVPGMAADDWPVKVFDLAAVERRNKTDALTEGALVRSDEVQAEDGGGLAGRGDPVLHRNRSTAGLQAAGRPAKGVFRSVSEPLFAPA